MEKWQFYLTIGACAGLVICAYMVYKLTGNFDTFTKGLTPILQGIADTLTKLVK
jgi:bacteriorhodopsin